MIISQQTNLFDALIVLVHTYGFSGDIMKLKKSGSRMKLTLFSFESLLIVSIVGSRDRLLVS